MRAAVFRLVDAKVSGVVTDRHEISDSIAYALYVAKLQAFGSRHDSGSPGRTTIGRDDVGAPGSGCPDDAGVHRADGNQQLGRTALLRDEGGLMVFLPCVLCISTGSGGNQENKQQHTL